MILFAFNSRKDKATIIIILYRLTSYIQVNLYIYMDYLYVCKKGTTMWHEMSNPAVLMRIGQRIKETRIRQRITQEELATASGVSPLTVANIEKGKSVSLLLFISVLRSLGLLENLEQLVPETRVSPIELKKLQGKKRYRVRHLKQDNHE